MYIIILCFPHLASEGVRRAFSLCTETLVPSIFPFLVCTNLLLECNFEAYTSALLKLPFEKLFHLNANLAFPYIIGIFSGYPQGALAILSIYKKGGCSKKEAEHALCFCNNTGAAFLFGAVPALFGEKYIGLQMFLLQIASALVFALLFRPKNFTPSGKTSKESKDIDLSLFVNAVINSLHPMAAISAFVLIFGFLSELIINISQHYSIPQFFTSAFLSLCEISNACSYISDADTSLKLSLLAFALCFSGICVHLQIYSCVKGYLSLKRFFFSKLFQGIFSFLAILFLKST